MVDTKGDSSSTSKSGAAQQQQQQPQAKALYEPDEASRLCNKWVKSGLAKNSAVQFLIQKLEDLGCQPPDGFVQCLQCEKPGAGFFGMVQEEAIINKKGNNNSNNKMNPAGDCGSAASSSSSLSDMLRREQSGESRLSIKPEIYLCQQYLENELMCHKTMVHELIHAIDQCRTNMDPLHNCLHIACTEIRAENLSGECSFWKELPRMEKFAGHGMECVRRRAILSVRGNPNCTKQAEKYVDAALPRCFQDIYPYERHPNQQR